MFAKHRKKIKKLYNNWEGPYVVLKRVSEVNYKIAKPTAKTKWKIVHVNNLKPYVDEKDIPRRQLRTRSQPPAGQIEEDDEPLEDDGKDEEPDRGPPTRGAPSENSPGFANAKLQARKKPYCRQALADYGSDLQDLFDGETTEPAAAPSPNLIPPDTPLPTRTYSGPNLTLEPDPDVKPTESAPRRGETAQTDSE